MPRPRGTGKGESARITLRFEPAELAYFGKRAQAAGVSTSAFIRHRLVEGMVAENAADIEARLVALMNKIPGASDGRTAPLSDEMMLSILTSEALLATVVQAQDVQALYTAQDAAKAKLKRMKAASAAL